MLGLDYWNHWRKAYHSGRQLYHKEMEDFYDKQIAAQKSWNDLIIRTVDTSIGMWTNLFTLSTLKQVDFPGYPRWLSK